MIEKMVIQKGHLGKEISSRSVPFEENYTKEMVLLKGTLKK